MTRPEFAQRVSLGDVITAVVAIIAAAGFAYSNAGDIRVQSERIAAIERMRAADVEKIDRDAQRLEARLSSSLSEIKASLARVEDKIDRAAEPTPRARTPQR